MCAATDRRGLTRCGAMARTPPHGVVLRVAAACSYTRMTAISLDGNAGNPEAPSSLSAFTTRTLQGPNQTC